MLYLSYFSVVPPSFPSFLPSFGLMIVLCSLSMTAIGQNMAPLLFYLLSFIPILLPFPIGNHLNVS